MYFYIHDITLPDSQLGLSPHQMPAYLEKPKHLYTSNRKSGMCETGRHGGALAVYLSVTEIDI